MTAAYVVAASVVIIGLLTGSAAGAQNGKTTRYWDCCKPSCSWNGKAAVSRPVATCAANGVTVQSDFNLASGCGGGPAYTCTNNAPWALSNTFALGFAAASITGLNEGGWCCACYELTFTSTSAAGKKMVVQVTNTGADLGSNHFDMQIPGGGVGLFNGCSSQWGSPTNGWGLQYGGVSSRAECLALPGPLQAGCFWRFDWFADNPDMTFQRVRCPTELTSKSQCVRNDDAGLPVYVLPGGGGGGGSISWTSTNDGIWSFACDFVAKDLTSAVVPSNQCSGKCKATATCTHYAWTNYQGGTCWMKKGGAMKQDAVAKSDPGMVCGILWAINWQGNWANGCDFKNNDLSNKPTTASQCGPACSSTAGCTHFTWTTYNGGTCWMKKGTISKSNAFSTLDASMLCGVK